jgi:hypothetical protein
MPHENGPRIAIYFASEGILINTKAWLAFNFFLIGTVHAQITQPNPEPKRLFGLIPNYRTAATPSTYQPLTSEQKFQMATRDSFDRGTILLALTLAGPRQATNSQPTFGHGMSAFGSYFGTGYADLVIANYMSENIYPVLFHQDPRYFRRGTGSGWSRTGYALSRIFWTRNDNGSHGFNYSEILGNSTAIAISNAYYPDNRTIGSATSGLALQLAVDGMGNLVKEFWPEIQHKFFHKQDPGKP